MPMVVLLKPQRGTSGLPFMNSTISDWFMISSHRRSSWSGVSFAGAGFCAHWEDSDAADGAVDPFVRGAGAVVGGAAGRCDVELCGGAARSATSGQTARRAWLRGDVLVDRIGQRDGLCALDLIQQRVPLRR